MVIAESQLLLTCVSAQKVALIERLRPRTVYSLDHKSRLARAKARLRLIDVAAAQLKTIDELIRQTEAAGGDREHEPIPPELEAAWPPPGVEIVFEGSERDEHAALCEALRDLTRLLRYEKRGASGLYVRSGQSNCCIEPA